MEVIKKYINEAEYLEEDIKTEVLNSLTELKK